MTIRMTSDCCQCIIDFDMPGETFVNFIQRCQIHKGFNNQALFDTVLTHNRGFPVRKAGSQATDAEKQANADEKRAERERILVIGPPEKRS